MLKVSFFFHVRNRRYFIPHTSGGGRGAGDREKRGREVYGRREKRGREAGFPRWREAGEKGEHCAMFRNRKNAKGREPKNTGREPGLKGTGSGRFKPPCPPPPHTKSQVVNGRL